MTQVRMSRRDFATRAAALLPAAALLGDDPVGAMLARGLAPDDGISHAAESIHQVVTFAAPPARVYAALTDGAQFTKITGGQAAEISRDAGGAFSLFGGQIKGRHIELIPDRRVVQAWRSEGWDPGLYSIAHFELNEQSGGTRLVFDHGGFPAGQAVHLAEGWKGHYWAALGRI
jgi:uncharacterized protein YndB with AHSA1/START domain